MTAPVPDAPADAPHPAVSKPPFRDLVTPGAEPAGLPHFGPLDPPDDEADRRPTLGERWKALPARRQKQILGAAVVVMACGVFLWPTGNGVLPPRVEARAEAPPEQPKAPEPIPPTPPDLRFIKFRMAAVRIPVNTQITRENLAVLLKDHEAKFGPADAVTSADRLIGKYVVAELNAGQIATRAAFADQPLPPPPEPAPAPRPAGPTERRVVRVLSNEGVRVSHYEFWPAGGWRIAREEFFPTPQPTPQPTLKNTLGGQQ